MGFCQRQPDIIIQNGIIVDDTGKLPYYADIANGEYTGERAGRVLRHLPKK